MKTIRFHCKWQKLNLTTVIVLHEGLIYMHVFHNLSSIQVVKVWQSSDRLWMEYHFLTAFIHTFMLTMDQMTVECVSCCLLWWTDIWHTNIKLCSIFQLILLVFPYGSLWLLSSTTFPAAVGIKLWLTHVRYLSSTKGHHGRVCN